MRFLKLFSVAFFVIVALATGGTAAFAAPAPTCGEAEVALGNAERDAKAARQAVRSAEAELEGASDTLSALQAERPGLLDLIAAAQATEPPAATLPGLLAQLVDLDGDISAAGTVVAAKQAALEDAQGDLSVLETALAAAIDARNKACAPAPVTVTPTTPVTPAPTFVDKDCDDFSTQAAAQALYNQDTRDPHNLDSNRNGVACDQFFSGQVDERVRVVDVVNTQFRAIPVVVGGIATGGA